MFSCEDRVLQCDAILEKIEELPERAAEFGESIQDKVESIRAWIEEHDDCTAAQAQALDNMEAGVDKWLS